MKKMIAAFALAMVVGCGATGEKSGDKDKSGTAVAGLKTFSNCREVKDFLVSSRGESSSKSGSGAGNPTTPQDSAAEDAASTASPLAAGGAEEADIVKRDGSRLYVLSPFSGLIIYDLADAAHPQRLGKVNVEHGREIHAAGNRVMVVSDSGVPNYGDFSYLSPKTKVQIMDVTNPATSTVVKEVEFDGAYSESRKVGSSVYLALLNHFGGDDAEIEKQLERCAPCEGVYAPETLDNGGNGWYVSWDLIGLKLDDATAAPTKKTVIGSYHSEIYATDERLYFVVGDGDWSAESETEVFLFGLSPSTASLSPLATASVPGGVVNQYSMDEFNGVFRIASTNNPFAMMGVDDVMGASALEADTEKDVEEIVPPQAKNYLTTFNVSGNTLNQLGQIDTIVPGEVITAVRFEGARVFVTTAIALVDPLVSINVSNPAAPVVESQIDLPGRPGYIHLWDHFLVTVGWGEGWDSGVAINVFDVANPAQPHLVEQESLAGYYSSEAAYDPRAFTFLEDRGQLAIPAYKDEDSVVVLLKIDGSGVTKLGEISHKSLIASLPNPTHYIPALRRALGVGNQLVTISKAGIKSNALANITQETFAEMFPDFEIDENGCSCPSNAEVCSCVID